MLAGLGMAEVPINQSLFLMLAFTHIVVIVPSSITGYSRGVVTNLTAFNWFKSF